MEACGSSHYWARELSRLGHEVKLIAPVYVKPYVKRGKSDAADAEAICEAVTRPTMRFVEIKSPEQQAILVAPSRARSDCSAKNPDDQHDARFVGRVRDYLCSRCRARDQFAKRVIEGHSPELPQAASDVVTDLSEQLLMLHERVNWYGRRMTAVAKSEPRIALLQTIPGIGPITASAIVATVGSGEQFRSGRDLSAWLGLTPINKSTGGKERLGRISKMGDRYIRRLMVVGMTSRIKQIKSTPERFDPWFADILQRKPAKLAAIAMANKTARIIWAVLSRNEPYQVTNSLKRTREHNEIARPMK